MTRPLGILSLARLRTIAARQFLALGLVAIAAISCATLTASVLRGASPHLIVGDGAQYYSWARSLTLDRDLDFGNDYELLYPPDPLPPEARERTPSGRVANKYPIGLALLEWPGLALGHGLAQLSGRWPADGASAPYQMTVSLTLVLSYLGCVYLLFLATVRLGAKASIAALFVGTMVTGTNLWHYLVKEPAMAHGAGMGLCCLAFFLVSRWPPRWDGVGVGSLLALGACVGLLLLVRNTNICVVPILAALLFWRRPLAARPVLIAAGACAAVTSLQPLALSLLWGEMRVLPYPGEAFTGGWTGIVGSLFSSRHGLFVYHPWYAVLSVMAVVGLLRRDLRALAVGAIASLGALVLVNGNWWCWWFGDSFGNRGFIEALPGLTVVAVLVASQLNPRGALLRVGIGAVAGVVLLNAVLWVGYVLRQFPADGLHTRSAAYLWFLSARR